MRKFVIPVAAAIALFAVLQAVKSETISQVSYYSGYTPDLVRHTIAGGEMPLILLGPPFPAQDIAARLTLPQYLAKASFKVLSADAAPTARMVLSFDAKGHYGGADACRSPLAHVSHARDAEMVVWAAFCYRDEVLAEGRLALPRGQAGSAEDLAPPLALLLEDVLPSDRKLVERGR